MTEEDYGAEALKLHEKIHLALYNAFADAIKKPDGLNALERAGAIEAVLRFAVEMNAALAPEMEAKDIEKFITQSIIKNRAYLMQCHAKSRELQAKTLGVTGEEGSLATH